VPAIAAVCASFVIVHPLTAVIDFVASQPQAALA
jgi:hypothetical protein